LSGEVPAVNNADVASHLTEIAELLELKGETSFRIRAYENAARALGNLPEAVRQLAAEGSLSQVTGVREGIVTHWMMVDLKHNHVSRVTLRGIDLNSCDHFVRQISGPDGRRIGWPAIFFPMNRVERVSLDEPTGSIPSMNELFARKIGRSLTEYLSQFA